jgi:hypothetical protein
MHSSVAPAAAAPATAVVNPAVIHAAPAADVAVHRSPARRDWPAFALAAALLAVGITGRRRLRRR